MHRLIGLSLLIGLGLAVCSCGPPPKVVVDTLRVVSWSPNQGASCIAVSPNEFQATVTFSDELDAETVSASSFFLEGPDGAIDAAISYDGSTQSAQLVPLGDLDHATAYDLVATADIMGVVQGRLVAELRSPFETVAAAGCYDAN